MSITIDLPENTLAALSADAHAQGRSVEQVIAEQINALYIEQNNETVAINEALDELDAGQGRPFAEFAQEFDTCFASSYGSQ